MFFFILETDYAYQDCCLDIHNNQNIESGLRLFDMFARALNVANSFLSKALKRESVAVVERTWVGSGFTPFLVPWKM